ncbi:HupE/UreJ family protein [uncultured Pseudacidovorax sp.]|uniref:HupE/UreJ family protein n=1 Tax=uncultured Pseudacidovorax sp. TaxID=679313 RepID=UPI0025F10991|nr:HupE/UreJ family protein [uncultured Pseudacidovorax sp.]
MHCADPHGRAQRLRLALCSLLMLPLLLLLAWPGAAHAHKASDAYLLIDRDGPALTVRWDIALRDLDAALDLDANRDQRLQWGEVRTRLPEITAYAGARLQLQEGRCALRPGEPEGIEDRVDGAYLVLRFTAACDTAGTLGVDYRLLGDVDPTHRGLLRLGAAGGGESSVRSLDPNGGPVSVRWPDAAGTDAGAGGGHGFFADGLHHILIGYDHLLFLLCLLLPAVMRRSAAGWTPVGRWRDAIWPIVSWVTLFTLAHSLTLALAALKIVSVSPRIVESAIAATILLAALDNLRPLLGTRRRFFSFGFGLIHGFGFAGALAELDLPTQAFASALLQFNLGVEAGQLLVVGIAMLVLLTLRQWRGYVPVVLRGGSVLAAILALVWLVERVFDLSLLPMG